LDLLLENLSGPEPYIACDVGQHDRPRLPSLNETTQLPRCTKAAFSVFVARKLGRKSYAAWNNDWTPTYLTSTDLRSPTASQLVTICNACEPDITEVHLTSNSFSVVFALHNRKNSICNTESFLRSGAELYPLGSGRTRPGPWKNPGSLKIGLQTLKILNKIMRSRFPIF
jgi:hypothetical protein